MIGNADAAVATLKARLLEEQRLYTEATDLTARLKWIEARRVTLKDLIKDSLYEIGCAAKAEEEGQK